MSGRDGLRLNKHDSRRDSRCGIEQPIEGVRTAPQNDAGVPPDTETM